MNNFFKIFCIVVFLSRCSNDLANSVTSDMGTLTITGNDCFPDVSDKYRYPVTEPDRWMKMDDSERIKLSQLPNQILNTISTLGLIRSFLDSPYPVRLPFLESSSPPTETYNRIYNMFNSSQTLLKRKDAAQALMYYYENVCFDCLAPSVDDVYVLNFSINLASLEFLFAKPEIMSQTNHGDKQKIVAMLLKNYRQWQNMSVNYGYESGIVPVMALIMYKDGDKSVVEYFKDDVALENLQTGYAASIRISDILLFAEKYVEK